MSNHTLNNVIIKPLNYFFNINNSKNIVNNKTFNGYYQNVRGLRTKLNTLRLNIYDLDFDYFFLTETWLYSDVNDNELGFHNLNIYRLDQNSNTSPYKRGGGVAFCVKKKILLKAFKYTYRFN